MLELIELSKMLNKNIKKNRDMHKLNKVITFVHWLLVGYVDNLF
jgi:preprotein translocase subunit Sec63